MKLFHSSNVAVSSPDVVHSRDYLDFGKGFYLTTLRDQAEKYAQRFIRRRQSGWLNEYSFEFDPGQWNILMFDSYSHQWLDFVSKCRKGLDDTDFDLVIGGIANDKVIQTLDRYFEGTLTAEQTLGILKYEKPNIQYCIRSQEMIDKCLIHLNSSEL